METVIHTVFRTKYLKKKHYKIFICYFHKFSVHDCTFEQLVSKTLIEIESAVKNKQKMCNFVPCQTLCQRQFFTTIKGIFKNRSSKMELAVTIINGSPIYAKSPVLARRLPDLSSITHIIVIL